MAEEKPKKEKKEEEGGEQKKGPKGGKDYVKVIKSVRSPKTGSYSFKEAIVHKDRVKDFLAD